MNRREGIRLGRVILGVFLGVLLNLCWGFKANASPYAGPSLVDFRSPAVQWTFQAKGWSRWLPAENGPRGSVTMDLLRNGVIPDPYRGGNAPKIAWISDCTWVYRAVFDVTILLGDTKFLQYADDLALVMRGVDTYGSLWLNGRRLLNFQNPHRTYTVRLPDPHKPSTPNSPFLVSGHNTLEWVLEPPLARVQILTERSRLPLPGGPWLHSRKAAYQFGWDWARAMPSVGLSGPLTLQVMGDSIVGLMRQGLYVRTLALDSLHRWARLDWGGGLSGDQDPRGRWHLQAEGVDASGGPESRMMVMNNPPLWWPNGMGEPRLVHGLLTLTDQEGRIRIQDSVHFGIRQVEWVQEEDSAGRSFGFRVNGRPCFIQGANWVPTDLWPQESDTTRSAMLLDRAVEAKLNMLRVWGGGHYASDDWMNRCDRLGLMVWHDFAYACAMFPLDSGFRAEALVEAEEQVLRLRPHPSLVLWCGNNETEEGWFNWGWVKEMGYSATDSLEVWQAYQNFFHRDLPELLRYRDADRPYHPSSPANGWGRERAYREGDVHQWAVWWGMKPFDHYTQRIGRFVSEFGFQGFPTLECMEEYGWSRFVDLNDSVLRIHQNHPRGFETIREYLCRDYWGPYADMADAATDQDWIYFSGMLQSDAMEIALRAQRNASPSCGGSLVWQWNDAWPVVSWSLLDYTGRPKPAWYAVRRVFGSSEPQLAPNGPDSLWQWPCSQGHVQGRWEPWSADSGRLVLRSTVPVHRLWLQASDVEWSDNSLDLTPFQDHVVTYKGRREALASLEIHRWCPSRHGVDRSALDFPILKH
ncbi:MAG: glycosyl hydrolase 2 galactose-binding domain-containing protein [Bacteroidota bacterium]